ncbi:protein lethal(2)essential for life-like [Limulus polyphemus]|uniref:Protein lethal(2)essential for life-like n=1 Tax=Limulus polyphemus TaxID=6850 RepID=A0ABM1T3W9_LIMPO|nr:protein lethal(2)essential for life-like [Limulus polyphemus]
MAFSRSLVPVLLGQDWWDAWDFPSRIADQHFGLGIHDSDILTPTLYHGYYVRPRRQVSRKVGSGLSQVKNEADKFQLLLDVSHFKPNEINVKTVDNCVVIEGKHEEKPDEHGFISRQFVRRYMLPKEVDPETVQSSLSSDGILTVEAPKKALEGEQPNERVVQIQMSDKPAVKEGQQER